MKKVALIVSLLSALGSLGAGHFYLQRLETEVSGGPKIGVLVATKDVAVGGILKEELLVVRDIPQAYIEERQVKADELQKVLGARVSGGLRANETVLWTDLAEFSDKGRLLSGLVTQGMRAVAVDGRDVDFGGLLRPGDRVDVLLTVSGADGASNSTRTLLQNLAVLSVGDNIARQDDAEGRENNRGKVTLSATVEGAQILAQARTRGQLSLALRNAGDVTMVEGLPETSDHNLIAEAPTDLARTKSSLGVAKGSIERVR